MEVTPLILEACQEYAYTMNSIIFDKYLSDSTTDLVPHSLVLPPKNLNIEAPMYGLLELER